MSTEVYIIVEGIHGNEPDVLGEGFLDLEKAIERVDSIAEQRWDEGDPIHTKRYTRGRTAYFAQYNGEGDTLFVFKVKVDIGKKEDT